jgi:hypothetical protein
MAESAKIGARFFVGTCGYSCPGDPPNGWGGVSPRWERGQSTTWRFTQPIFIPSRSIPLFIGRHALRWSKDGLKETPPVREDGKLK